MAKCIRSAYSIKFPKDVEFFLFLVANHYQIYIVTLHIFMLASLRKSFITGIVLTLPIGITLFFINLMLRYIGAPASKILFCWMDASIRNTSVMYLVINVVSICLVVILIVLVGFISKLFLGKFIISLTEKLINHVPFVSTVYKTVKQVINTFGANRDAAFSKVVLIEYPKQGCYAIGFLSSKFEGEVLDKIGKPVLNVFVPTTPNPTSGFLLVVPEKDVTTLEMSVTDGMKFIISGGIVIPPHRKITKK
ncbi:MAG: DUF502 domain-containing protein [Puniceicoccales bacterium]|jgi:uncharacterized membrane protein|nr:DUF502 domain-containing protein [Puniceicoccales bacterium]